MLIQISWLLWKPTDLDLHCLQRQSTCVSRFNRTRLKTKKVLILSQCFSDGDIVNVHPSCYLLQNHWSEFNQTCYMYVTSPSVCHAISNISMVHGDFAMACYRLSNLVLLISPWKCMLWVVRGASNEYPRHTVLCRNKKKNYLQDTSSYLELCDINCNDAEFKYHFIIFSFLLLFFSKIRLGISNTSSLYTTLLMKCHSELPGKIRKKKNITYFVACKCHC